MEGQQPPEMITLPKTGGQVWFRDIEELSGVEYHKIRDISGEVRVGRKSVSDMLLLAATMLITRWEIPGFPNLPAPGSEEGDGGKILGILNWKDVRVIDEHLLRACSTLNADSDKDPTTPPPSD